MKSPYKRPILARIYYTLAAVIGVLIALGGGLAVIGAATTAGSPTEVLIAWVGIAVGVLIASSAVVLLVGLGQLFDLIGKIEYNTRPEPAASPSPKPPAPQVHKNGPGSITGF